MTEGWPTEEGATVALHAAATKAWDLNRGALPPSMSEVAFDDLPKVTQLEIKNSVLPIVWAALAALPDPRHGAWEEGHEACASRFLRSPIARTHGREPENPYPSGL